MQLRQKVSMLTPALMALTLAVSTAYAQDDADKAKATNDSATRSTQSQSQAAPAAPAEKRAGAATAATRATLTDGQILQIIRSLNDGEIKQAEEALDEGQSQEVKTLAEMLKTDHEESNKALDELLEGDRNLEDSPVDDQLKASAEQTHERLQDLAGNQYDCAYINAQVSQHEAALAMAKDQLMPNAKAPEVGKMLTTKQTSLEHHLQMAKDALGKVQGCSATQTSQSQQAPRSTQ